MWSTNKTKKEDGGRLDHKTFWKVQYYANMNRNNFVPEGEQN